jgi:hypothetical protein
LQEEVKSYEKGKGIASRDKELRERKGDAMRYKELGERKKLQ